MGLHHPRDVPRNGGRDGPDRRDLCGRRRAVRQIAPQPFEFGGDCCALAFEEISDGVAEALVGNEMCGAGDYRLITPADLVLALGARLNGSQAVLDRPFDRPIITKLEVKERTLLGTAPV